MLGALFAVGTEGSDSLRHGHTTLPAYREHLHYRVISTKQGKPVSLPQGEVKPQGGPMAMRV
jgi:hypothetical protein